jgi:hypothetical protein
VLHQLSGYSRATSSNGRPPVGRRSSTGGVGKTTPERRGGYKVKIASTGSLGEPKAQPMRQKLDLKDMDGTVFTDENSVDSQSNLFPGRQKAAVGRKESTLSFIEEERGSIDDSSSRRPPEGGMLEENLLKIGMKDTKKKKQACCVVS